jgi:hypothetical protein
MRSSVELLGMDRNMLAALYLESLEEKTGLAQIR